jgi:hypothetical protein
MLYDNGAALFRRVFLCLSFISPSTFGAILDQHEAEAGCLHRIEEEQAIEEEHINASYTDGQQSQDRRRHNTVISRGLLSSRVVHTAGTLHDNYSRSNQIHYSKSKCMLKAKSRGLGHPATYLCKLGSRQR